MNALCIISVIAGFILVYIFAYALCRVAGDDDERNGRQEWQQ